MKPTKLICCSAALALCTLAAAAQERITWRDGSQTEVRIEEINDNTVKYRRAADPDGPLFISSRKDMQSIYTSDGELLEWNNHSTHKRAKVGMRLTGGITFHNFNDILQEVDVNILNYKRRPGASVGVGLFCEIPFRNPALAFGLSIDYAYRSTSIEDTYSASGYRISEEVGYRMHYVGPSFYLTGHTKSGFYMRGGFRFDFLSNMNISINSREAASFQGEKYVLSNQNKRLFQPGFLVGMGYTSGRVDIGIGTVAYFTSIWNKDSGMFSHVWPLTFELAVRFGRN